MTASYNDELISDITDVVDILDKAGKDWTEKAAMATRQSKQSDDHRKLAEEVGQLKSALSAKILTLSPQNPPLKTSAHLLRVTAKSKVAVARSTSGPLKISGNCARLVCCR